MAIKNYTTQITVEKTVGEIENILSKHGAKKILKEYDGAGNVVGVSFIIDLPIGTVPFKLPIELKAWIALINQAVKDKKLPKRFLNDAEQSRKVGWRVIRDWIDAQMALVETKTVKFEQVFLPYVFDVGTNETVYEKFISNAKKFVTLPENTENNQEVLNNE